MPLPAAAVGAIVGTAIRRGVLFVVKRPITSAAGAVVGYVIAADAGEDLGEILPDELDALNDALDDAGIALRDFATDIGNATLGVLREGGVAFVDGVENTYDYIRDKLRGKEPDIIAAVTVGALTVLAGVYLFNAAKRGTMTYTE